MPFALNHSLRAWRKSFDLKLVKAPAPVSSSAKFRLFCCMRNELFRLPFFLKYYRRLGVEQFYFIDNDSNDGTLDYLLDQEDCAVWHTASSYRSANFGMDWCNHLLRRYGAGSWSICVDPDEFLLYPSCETRNLKDLSDYMSEVGQRSLFTTMVDFYSDRPVTETYLGPDESPFTVCPYFDRFNFTQSINVKRTRCWVQGGVRMRKMFYKTPQDAPALNKVPLVQWQRNYFYISSMHHTNIESINCTVNQSSLFVSGCLAHFKYVSALKDKAKEEIARKQHYNDSLEYKKYLEEISENLFDAKVSIKYTNSEELEKRSFMQRGEWF